MIINNKMSEFIEQINAKNEDVLDISIEELSLFCNVSVKKIYDCLILSSRKTNVTKEQFEKVVSYNTDKSGYEYSNNDCRIVDFFKSQLTIEQQYKLARVFIQCLNNRLISLTENEIVYIIGIDNNLLTLHFYQKRENEVIIDENDVENFEEAIGIISSEELSLNVLQNISDE